MPPLYDDSCYFQHDFTIMQNIWVTVKCSNIEFQLQIELKLKMTEQNKNSWISKLNQMV